MKHREFNLSSGIKIFLGKNAESNDELMKKYKGKENTILHTAKPGSPFCIIEKINPNKEEIKESAIICAAKSQDYRDKKSDVELHLFSGKQVKKQFWMKAGSWKLTTKPKVIKVKKKEIELWLSKNSK